MTAVNHIVKRYIGLVVTAGCLFLATKEVLLYVHPPCASSSKIFSVQRQISHRDVDSIDLRAGVQEVLIKLDRNKELAIQQTNLILVQPAVQEPTAVSYNTEFAGSRLKLWYGGRCIDSDERDQHLVVAHCDPDQNQLFTLTADGQLRYDRTGKCVVLHKWKKPQLSLFDCTPPGTGSEVLTFKMIRDSFLQTEVDGKTLCVSPTTQTDFSKANKYCCLNVPIALTPCDEEASRLEFIEESFFRHERRSFVDTLAPLEGTCDFKACGLNKPAEPVQTFKPLYSSRCLKVFDCVTVVTKTARRPYLVTRLAKSIRDIKGYDLRIISYDDGPDDYPPEVYQEIAKYPHLIYIVGEDEDMGISTGRNLALQLVKTKYFLLVDDDHVFNAKSNLEKMVEILDTTDATLVGGKFEGFMKFAGALKFGYYHDRQEFVVFSGYCERQLPQFGCEQCDSTSNIFLAKTEPVIEIGGWSEELKIAEHADFFVKMKAHGKKVVYCEDIEVINQQETPEERSLSYQKLRYDMGRKNRMFRLMNSRYNVNGLFWCSDYEELENGELKCLETKHKIGYC